MENTGQVRQPAVQPQQAFYGALKKFPVPTQKNLYILIASVLLTVIAGVFTGWYLSGGKLGKGVAPTSKTAPGATSGLTEAGVSNEEAFPDTAQGTLAQGGIEGEGTHHLDRGQGPQNFVYLTSTVIDLESFVGKKVEVWGQSITAKRAGWLMDVGRIKVIQ